MSLTGNNYVISGNLRWRISTRKILNYSNVVASTSNVVAVYIMGNPQKLDVGGLLVTAIRLFSDVKFITKLKEEFAELQKLLQDSEKTID